MQSSFPVNVRLIDSGMPLVATTGHQLGRLSMSSSAWAHMRELEVEVERGVLVIRVRVLELVLEKALCPLTDTDVVWGILELLQTLVFRRSFVLHHHL